MVPPYGFLFSLARAAHTRRAMLRRGRDRLQAAGNHACRGELLHDGGHPALLPQHLADVLLQRQHVFGEAHQVRVRRLELPAVLVQIRQQLAQPVRRRPLDRLPCVWCKRATCRFWCNRVFLMELSTDPRRLRAEGITLRDGEWGWSHTFVFWVSKSSFTDEESRRSCSCGEGV